MLLPANKTIHNLRYAEWLVVGKGPSFSELKGVQWSGPAIFLNHAMVEGPKTGAFDDPNLCFGHAVDLEAMLESVDDAMDTCFGFILPWIPNMAMKRGRKSLMDIVRDYDVLWFLNEQDRLFFYNRTGSCNFHPLGVNVDVSAFSAEGAVGLLCKSEVVAAAHVGLDGGTKYAEEFAHLRPLMNGQSSFDPQFGHIQKAVDKFGMSFRELTNDEGVSVYTRPLAEAAVDVGSDDFELVLDEEDGQGEEEEVQPRRQPKKSAKKNVEES